MNKLSLFLAAGLLATAGAAQAEDPNSLYSRKLGVIKGTAPGITLIEGPRRAPEGGTPATPAAPSSKAGATTATAATPAAAATTADAAPARAPLVFEFKPPSGAPVSSIKRLEGPDVGIPLPTGSAPPDKQRKSDGR